MNANKLSDHELETYIKDKSAIVIKTFKKREFQGILMVAGSELQNIAPLLMAPYLQKLKAPINLLLMPDLKTNTIIYDFYSELTTALGIKFKILPIKFLQSLFKNTYREYFNNENLFEKQSSLAGIRQPLVSSLCIDNNFLFLDSTSKTEFIQGKPPICLPFSNLICPFGNMHLSDLHNLIQLLTPENLKNNLNIFWEASNLETLPDKDACLDKSNELNNHAKLNHYDYYPII